MQIADLVNQYYQNLSGGGKVAGGTKGVKQISSALLQMSVGNVFEGNVNKLEGNLVTLGLSNGQTLQARLEEGVELKLGQAMFFEVKSNHGGQISIRPFSNGIANNPILLQALQTAGLPANDKMLAMVNTMMEQSMPIDKNSLQTIARMLANHSELDISTLVEMHKLGLPMTEEMVSQYSNYREDRYAIRNELETLMEQLPDKMTSMELPEMEWLSLNKNLIDVITQGLPEGALQDTLPKGEGEAANVIEQSLGAQDVQGSIGLKENEIIENRLENIEINDTGTKDIRSDDIATVDARKAEFAQELAAKEAMSEETVRNVKQISENIVQNAEVSLSQERMSLSKEFMELLKQIPQLTESGSIFGEDGTLRNTLDETALLKEIGMSLSKETVEGKEVWKQLLTHKDYQTLLRKTMQRQWLLLPKEVAQKDKIPQLYQRLDQQMQQLEQVFKQYQTTSFMETAGNIRSNIEFMNHLNQMVHYVQIPLKLSGQNVHSELYVFSGGKKKNVKEEEVSAFLHLDLEHLGSTDVSIRMKQKQVRTNFYLEDDRSYELLMEHMPDLEERLKRKGYSSKITVEKQNKTPSFMEQIAREYPQASSKGTGMVHRYSFDVMA